jgi:purine-cytosine permease-like protein
LCKIIVGWFSISVISNGTSVKLVDNVKSEDILAWIDAVSEAPMVTWIILGSTLS